MSIIDIPHVMSLTEAALLGLVQGITEFLPISSSGHLILVESLLHLDVEKLKLFDITLHLGTLLAILLYFRKSLFDFKLYPYLILGSLPAILIGFTLGDSIDELFRHPESVAFFLIAVGLLFFIPTRKDKKTITGKTALFIGLAQACALIPGVSRSGATILTGNQLGLSQTEAARFSFLLGAIAIAGAGTLKALELGLGTNELTNLDTWNLGVGFISAFVSSLLAVSFLMRYLTKHSLKVFGVYRLLFGGAFLFFMVF
jgi:undecaprenyl-diphosphatase